MAYRFHSGLGDDPAPDPGQALTSAIQSAKDNMGTVLVIGLAMLVGIGWLTARSGRRR